MTQIDVRIVWLAIRNGFIEFWTMSMEYPERRRVFILSADCTFDGFIRYAIRIDNDAFNFDQPTCDGVYQLPPELEKIFAANPQAGMELRAITSRLMNKLPVSFPIVVEPPPKRKIDKKE